MRLKIQYFILLIGTCLNKYVTVIDLYILLNEMSTRVRLTKRQEIYKTQLWEKPVYLCYISLAF